MMVLGIKSRLVVLGLAAGLMGALIILVTLNSQQRVNQARQRLGAVDVESFRITDHFTDKLRYANDKMRRYATAHDTEAWQEFLTACQELKDWIQQQAGRLKTPREVALIHQMNERYAMYEQRARDLHHRMESSGEPGASLAEYNGFFEEARGFLDVGRDLARAHFESRNQVLGEVNATLGQLRLMVLGLVVLLFVCGVALAVSVYHGLLAPLRVRLVESEALAQRNEKLASLGVLAAGVAHEIRNPLTALKTALFIQQKKLPTSANLQETQVIEREIRRLERIVTEFLQFARPAAPQLQLIPADLPLREVQELLGPELAKADIQLVQESCAPMQIQVDPGQMKQVLINLVQNAADSIGAHGKIILRARTGGRTPAQPDTETVAIEVADTGKGIAPEVQKRLFDPFFTTKENGTGLGLSIAARLAEMNGGTLQYQTRLGQGSSFTIVLPRRSEEQRLSQPSSAPGTAPTPLPVHN